MRTYGGYTVHPLLLTHDKMEISGELHAQATLTLIPTQKEAGWVLQLTWGIWNREKSFAHARNQTTHPCFQLTA